MTTITFRDFSLDYFRYTAVEKTYLILICVYPYQNGLHIGLCDLIIEHVSYITMHIYVRDRFNILHTAVTVSTYCYLWITHTLLSVYTENTSSLLSNNS